LKKRFNVLKINGPHMIFKRGILKKRLTLKFNIKHLPKNVWKWRKIYNLMRSFNPDLCISDMEPLVPMLSNWYNLPLLSMDNQHRLTETKIKVPEEYYKEYFMAKGVVNMFVRNADWNIIIDFSNLKPVKKNTFVVAPIIRDDVRILKNQTKNSDNILVYLTKKNRSIIKVLEDIPENFIVYGYNKKKKKRNLEFKKKQTFLQDLKDCKAIIATAGFTLISEALYLRKPYFALPLQGQFEQTLNALCLKQAGFGEYSENLKKQEIQDFLKNLKKYRKSLRKYNPDYNKLFKVIDKILVKLEKKNQKRV